ncbi:glycosyltransferase [Sutcliffiella sp. NPDC057660]|uniref:glycosyltransferase n=1 Tax=Sutcliffiella sp. NPDC057660 TaxID=3346199 RepID=UPI00367E7F37
MKKKILFMVINMNIGGTEKALLNMINEMPREEFDITIMMLENYGGFLNHIPKWVNVKFVNGYKEMKDILNDPPREMILKKFRSENLFKVLKLCIIYFLCTLKKERRILFKFILKYYPIDSTEYDIAVAYAGPMDFISYFVLEKIIAKKKIQWIHFDINKIGFNITFSSKLYKQYDQIAVVSEEAKEKFLMKLPLLENKTILHENIISSEQISKLANKHESFNDSFDGIRILTVGRLTYEKGQDLAINAMSKLIKNGYKVRWYCIGEGKSREKYEKQIEENNLVGHFILLGSKTNPYPFIKDCDIYVQPSRYEGYCITTLEARFLNKPIITTEVNGAKEQFLNRETGLIVKINEEEIYKSIRELIGNEILQKKLENNLRIFNSTHNKGKTIFG